MTHPIQTLKIPFATIPQPRHRNSKGCKAYYDGEYAAIKSKFNSFITEKAFKFTSTDDYPLEIDIELYQNINKSSDLDNHLKFILDRLVDCKVIKNDNCNSIRKVSIELTESRNNTALTEVRFYRHYA